MWEPRKIERKLQALLHAHPAGESVGEALFARYVHARDTLVTQVLPNIPGVEPSLTEHGAPHIANVLDNAYRLLDGDAGFSDAELILSPIELYALCLCILFHDVGNVFSRDKHETQVGKVYDWVFGSDVKMSEKSIVVRAAGAHAGKTEDGNRDTLAKVPRDASLLGEPLRLADIAAILRFADELAEGPQRTSRFMSDFGIYSPDSHIYHAYANVTEVHIDRGNARIALTYNLQLQAKPGEIDARVRDLRELLPYIYKRIVKLDQERQYTRHYSRVLEPFRATQARFNFWLNGELHELSLEPLVLSDLRVIPGENSADLQTRAGFAVEDICTKVCTALETSLA